MEAVHRQVADRVGSEVGAEAGEQGFGEGRLAGTRRAGDAQHHPARTSHERLDPLQQLGQRVDLTRRGRTHGVIVGAVGGSTALRRDAGSRDAAERVVVGRNDEEQVVVTTELEDSGDQGVGAADDEETSSGPEPVM